MAHQQLYDEAHETVELLRSIGRSENLKAVDIIERLLDRCNHLTNTNDGLRETLDEQRKGLAELRTMLAIHEAD